MGASDGGVETVDGDSEMGRMLGEENKNRGPDSSLPGTTGIKRRATTCRLLQFQVSWSDIK